MVCISCSFVSFPVYVPGMRSHINTLHIIYSATFPYENTHTHAASIWMKPKAQEMFGLRCSKSLRDSFKPGALLFLYDLRFIVFVFSVLLNKRANGIITKYGHLLSTNPHIITWTCDDDFSTYYEKICYFCRVRSQYPNFQTIRIKTRVREQLTVQFSKKCIFLQLKHRVFQVKTVSCLCLVL